MLDRFTVRRRIPGAGGAALLSLLAAASCSPDAAEEHGAVDLREASSAAPPTLGNEPQAAPLPNGATGLLGQEAGDPIESTPASLAALYAAVQQASTSANQPDPAAEAAPPAVPELAAVAGPTVQAPLPGDSARTVLTRGVDEAENLFFTEDGRLFVSSAENIFEIKRGVGGLIKTDHFDEDCVVEGIVRSENYLYGVCWTLDQRLNAQSFLIGGELTADPAFRIIATLDKGAVANGMTVDPEGRVYLTYTTSVGQIVRLNFSAPLKLQSTEIWASDLPNVNGIKYVDGSMYVTLLNDSLTSEFVRIPVLEDGSAGATQSLFQRWLTVFDDVLPFEGGFILTDFLKGTLIFWDPARGAYAETPSGTFHGPTSLARGRPPLFTERQLVVAEKGMFLIRGERNGDLLSMYQLP